MSLELTLEQLLADFSEWPLPGATRREIDLPSIPGKVDVLAGIRRAGKTWCLFQIIGDLNTRGVDRNLILYLNFEDERLLPMHTADLHRVPEVFFRRYPEATRSRCHFFFDEIQRVDGWETFVRRLLDTLDVQIHLTGSSARLLSREIATQLRGRSMTTEVFPFSFSEALAHRGIETPARYPGLSVRATLEHAFRDYLVCGGFPEAQSLPRQYFVKMIQGYVDVVLFRDVVERYAISSTTPLRYMIRHLLNSPGSLFSVNKFFNDLKSQGIAISKNTLHDYLGHLEDCYFFFPIPIHAKSERARMVNPKKVYPVDSGFVTAMARGGRIQWGHLLECAVFMHLRRTDSQLTYYRTQKGREVDFMAVDMRGRRGLIQVCADISDPEIEGREVKALGEAMAESGLNRSTLVTLADRRRIHTDSGTIEVVPAWWWFLNPKDVG